MTRTWPLGARAGSERRRLRNPKYAERGRQPLACLRPGRDVTVFSLPAGVERALGERAVTKALEVLERWNGEPVEDVDGRSRSIVVYLHESSELRVVDERVRFARGRFGAGEGLSSSRKPRVTRRNATELAVVVLD